MIVTFAEKIWRLKKIKPLLFIVIVDLSNSTAIDILSIYLLMSVVDNKLRMLVRS